MTSKQVKLASPVLDAQLHEDTHVHAIYDRIASHFASTRYKPWPIVAAFLNDIPTGSIGLDAGTGNGKYLPLPLDGPRGRTWTIGLDRSRNLLQIARTAGADSASSFRTLREVVCGDVLDRPWRNGVFDYALSIATIHHLATGERRRFAVERLLQSVASDHGRILIYVWAIEQDDLSKRSMPGAKGSDPKHGGTPNITSEDTSDTTLQGQDVFVPWVLNSPQATNHKTATQRKRRSPHKEEQAESARTKAREPLQVFNRYYHMFAEGELEKLVHDAADALNLQVGAPSNRFGFKETKTHGVEIVQSGWERSNYYVELRRWLS